MNDHLSMMEMETAVMDNPTAAIATMEPEAAWQATLGELKLQMTRATFNTWVKDTAIRRVRDDGTFVVQVKNEYAQEWLDKKLRVTIERTLADITGQPTAVEFVLPACDELEPMTTAVPDGDTAVFVPPPPEPEAPANGHSTIQRHPDGYKGNMTPEQLKKARDRIDRRDKIKQQQHTSPPADVPGEFNGFAPASSNFTKCPDQFFDYIVPYENGGITKIVAAVIRQTLGTFVDKRHQQTREEWPCNNTLLKKTAGISGRDTVLISLWEARDRGYVVLRDLSGDDHKEERLELKRECGHRVNYTLRLRFDDEPVDHPAEPRPYGNSD